MRSQHNRLEFSVGIVVLIIASYFFYVAYNSSNKAFQDTYKIHALFDRIDGLNIGSDVKISGVKVGYVNTYSVDPKTYQAKVEFFIRSDLKIPSDTTAIIASESLLGGKYISLQIGANKESFKAGDTIHDTQSSLNIESMIGKYMFSNEEKK